MQLARAHDTAYRAKAALTRLPLLASHVLLGKALRLRSAAPPPDADVIAEVQRRYRALLDLDLQNVKSGAYPRALLWEPTVWRHVRAIPEALRQLPGTLRRALTGNFRDLPQTAEDPQYPKYYQRNFHWQTDGYFSERSARVYDLQVDWLFLGATNMMRRQVLPPITERARQHQGPLAILDVATGTGANLHQLRMALPDAHLTGLDLSPYYLNVARDRLGDAPSVTLVQDNAEAMPFADESFDVVTSIYLFHELPKDARRRVMAEMYRVLRPGGLLVVQDSAQTSESAAIAKTLMGFANMFHEPYYRGYLGDDLATAFADAGFRDTATWAHFVSKTVVASKGG